MVEKSYNLAQAQRTALPSLIPSIQGLFRRNSKEVKQGTDQHEILYQRHQKILDDE